MVTVAGLVVAGAVYISPPGQTSYSAKLVNTGGLEAGDQVRIAGIRKGKVASVDLTGTFITVRFRLDDSIAVRSDATANVRLITLLVDVYWTSTQVQARRPSTVQSHWSRQAAPTTFPARLRQPHRCSVTCVVLIYGAQRRCYRMLSPTETPISLMPCKTRAA